MIRKAIVIGGSNGIGLAMALQLSASDDTQVTIIDKVAPAVVTPENVSYERHDLLDGDYGFLEKHSDIDALVFTAGYGRVAPFESFLAAEIRNQFLVNAVSPIEVLRYFFPRMKENRAFYCVVMGSIAGIVSSPLLALYSSTKASIGKAAEAINIELEMSGSLNRVLNVSPGSIKGTRFNGGQNDLASLDDLSREILARMYARETLYIPDYESVFKGVIERYRSDAHQFGVDSYLYKKQSGRMNLAPQVKIGYMSGTWDLFHIGHLNMIKRARQYCDYLVVGVHKDASHKGKETFIPLEERMEIVRSIKWVDKVVLSMPEDSDVYSSGLVKYDYLFVGSDYKGTDRFNRYEAFFADKGVKIIYFPYTEGTSSTQIRNLIISKQNEYE